MMHPASQSSCSLVFSLIHSLSLFRVVWVHRNIEEREKTKCREPPLLSTLVWSSLGISQTVMTPVVSKAWIPAGSTLCGGGSKKCVRGPRRGVPPSLCPCSLQTLKKPIIPKEFGGKVPTVIRQRYLNLFIEECLKFCSSNQEAIEKVGDLGVQGQVLGGRAGALCRGVRD